MEAPYPRVHPGALNVAAMTRGSVMHPVFTGVTKSVLGRQISSTGYMLS